jgi:hypothetical protein
MNADEAQIILSWQVAEAGVPIVWGWQNEAKTKPKSGVVRAVYGRIGFMKRPVLWGHSEFLAGLKPKAVGRVKLQNEATILADCHRARQAIMRMMTGKDSNGLDGRFRTGKRSNPGESK